jgi:ATP-dependent phosphoenolpyruvate carboxykinase
MIASRKYTRTALERALAYLNAGWVKGHFKHKNKEGKIRFCLVGSINETSINGARDEAINALYEALPVEYQNAVSPRRDWEDEEQYLQRILDRKRWAIMTFNDNRRTRKADVMKVAQKAITSV